MSELKIVVDEKKLRELVYKYFDEIIDPSYGHDNISESDIKIEVKSKQNWKSEWEAAEFRAIYHKTGDL